MKNVSRNARMRGIFLVSIFIVCAAVVLWRRFSTVNSENPGQQHARDSLFQQKRVLVYNAKAYRQAVQLAHDGDIVVRLGTDMTSELLRRMNLKDPAYSHAGIISKEHDTVFVYHALGGEFNPDQQLIKEPLWLFGHPKGNKRLGLYRIAMDSLAIKRLIVVVQQTYQQHIPFDTAFSLATKDRLYCTEFVANSFENALHDTAFFHRSQVGGKLYIGVDDLTEKAKKIHRWEY